MTEGGRDVHQHFCTWFTQRCSLAVGAMCATPGEAPAAIGIESIRVTVDMDAETSSEALRTLGARAVLCSPVASTLHDPVHVDVALRETSVVGQLR